MAAQPAYVQDFVKKLPPRWADVRFVAGFPGEYAVLARQAPGGQWYLAGINATDAPKTLQARPGQAQSGRRHPHHRWRYQPELQHPGAGGKSLRLTLPARGGFVVQP
ncbi:glycoside hydrolase family 97 C-terminal domain-containing protein [Hymenobacter humi]|uniref:Glycoside hydrolase family 97 C-terminal domain-containing protein n=1 Tax=Hymenobacter humi TaxID=1411620 RepID=A0ABW2UBC1_9BACT